jgi:uncharacterized protein YydD (DUF2326 family)
MKLIELGCDQPSFKALCFNPNGLTLIIGDGSKDRKKDGSSNGVGKTLTLGLVHHCLGAKIDAKLKTAAPEWLFSLIFSLSRKEHRIERSGDGRRLTLDGRNISVTALRKWLDECGAFRIDPTIPGLSFRSLFKRFTRHQREDCIDPLRTAREPDFDARLRSLYLLGLDCSLAINKRDHKNQLEIIKRTKDNWQHDQILKDLFRSGSQPKVRAEWLDREIPRLKSDLEQFQVAEDYRAIELQAGELTKQLRDIEKQLAILRFQIEGIDKALAQQPDISREDLLELYKGLQEVFKPEALAHFQNVEAFHSSLAANRQSRLERDQLRLRGEMRQIETQRQRIAKQRDEQLRALQGKRALDEYAVLARQLAVLEEERQRLNDYLNITANLQRQVQEIKEKKVEEDRLASNYVHTQPVVEVDKHFTALAELLYPRHPAGIVLDNNVGDNQVRFDLTVQIEGDDSDGINAARILCFDWLLLMHGANHTMGFLWHDNRLFADIDPRPRAAWFRHVLQALPRTGKQYIATLNTENFNAMEEYLSPEEWAALKSFVRLTLRGDQPKNKLLGIQFGASSNGSKY